MLLLMFILTGWGHHALARPLMAESGFLDKFQYSRVLFCPGMPG